MHINRVVNKVKCNGLGITKFAHQYGALTTAAFLGKYRTGKVIIKDLAVTTGSYKKQQLIPVVVVATE